MVGGPTNKLTFASAAAVSATKPGGTPGQLAASWSYPPNTNFNTPRGGNLASQVVALTINTSLTLQYAGIGGLTLFGLTGDAACYNNMTVSAVLAIANGVLGGAAPPCGNIGTLTGLLGGSLTGDATGGLNPSFDKCVASQWAIEHLR